MENQIQLYHDATTLLLEQDLVALENVDKRLHKRYQEGYQKGLQDAKDCYRVIYLCKVCGGLPEVTHDNEKQAVRQYMREHGWGHGDCVR